MEGEEVADKYHYPWTDHLFHFRSRRRLFSPALKQSARSTRDAVGKVLSSVGF